MRANFWKIVLPILNLSLAFTLFHIGSRQFEVYESTHPGEFYHGRSWYIPPAWRVSRALNAPAFIAGEWLHDTHRVRGWWQDDWFHYGSIEYYIAVVMLWSWIGAQADRRFHISKLRRLSGIVASSVGGLFAVYMLVISIVRPWEYYAGGSVLRLFVLIWSILLLCYCGREVLYRLGSHPSQDTGDSALMSR